MVSVLGVTAKIRILQRLCPY